MKTYTRAEIIALLDSNPVAVERGIKLLHSLQTTDERATWDTKYDNSQGFSKRTVTRGTAIAEKLLSGEKLDETDYAAGREVCAIHWRQLLKEANANACAKHHHAGFVASEARLAPYVAEFARWGTL